MNERQENWGNFASFYRRFIQGFSKSAKPLTLILRTTPTRSAENSPSNMAEDAEVGESDGDDDETVKDHLPRSRADLRGILPPYASQKSTIRKATKQSSCRAHASLYNSRCFVGITNWALIRSTGLMSSLNAILYQLSIYNFLGTRTPFSGTSSLSLTFRQSFPLQSAWLLTDMSMLGSVPNQGCNHARGPLAYQTFLYILRAYLLLHQVGKTHVLPRAALVLQYILNQANRQRLLLGLRPENLPVLRYWGVTLLRLPMFQSHWNGA